jgi:pre-mRNA-splicing factor SYF1
MSENSTSGNAKSLLSVVSTAPSLLHQEDAVSRAPYNVTAWIQYLDAVDEDISEVTSKGNKAPPDALLKVRDFVGRRAVQHLPKSYKLWKSHWEFCLAHEKELGGETSLGALWERALVTLHKFPKVWVEYLEYAHENSSMDPTQLRHLANRALEAIPVTQHEKIWPVLLKYYQSTDTTWIPKETKLSLLRRYIQFSPAATKEVADFLANDLHHWGEAALLYVKLLNQPEVVQRNELWMALANICTRHPVEQVGIDWEALVRGVLKTKNYKEMEGVLWNQLADAWIRRGEFQLARSVYEEALESVSKVRDFTILLDAYLQFEEGLLEATMAAAGDEEEEEEEGGETDSPETDKDDWDLLLPNSGEEDASAAKKSSMSDLELALARAEDLTARRPILLNRVLLRQNPHDVGEWLKRARLYKEKKELAQAQAALEDGLRTVHARRAVGGSPSQMVTQLVSLYESDPVDGVAKARDLMDRICNQWVYEFKHTDDLAECHAAWVEFELRQEAWDEALDIIRSSVVVPPSTPERPVPKNVRGLVKSLRLWDLLLDLEESLGTAQTTKDAYSRAIEQRVATPLHILNFATFLTEHKYFEESFSAYERGIELFEYPGVKVIWKAYLDGFFKRYAGTKVERSRDLFHRCIEACPPEECTEFFLMSGAFEEEHGLTKRALGVYRDMCHKVPAEEKYTAYQLFIAKTTKYMGQTATRDIYQSAIQDLGDAPASQLCLDFAKMETSLQEVDRARAVLTYGAQTADPRRNEEYWREWNEFEIAHGNEETFREMLRIKRSVEASFSTVNYNAAEMSTPSAKADTLSNEEAMRMIAEREGVELDPRATAPSVSGFVSAKRSAGAAQLDDVEERVAKLRKATAEMSEEKDEPADADEDADEIDIDDMDEEEEQEEGHAEAVKDVSTKAVPAAVFGGLAKLAEEDTKKQ